MLRILHRAARFDRVVLLMISASVSTLLAGCVHDPSPRGEVLPLPHPIQANEGPPIDRREVSGARPSSDIKPVTLITLPEETPPPSQGNP